MKDVLENRDLRLVLGVRLLDSLGVQIVSVAVAWQVYELTRDPLLLGMVGLAGAVPFIAAALWAGHLADRREKAAIVSWGEVLTGLSAASLALLAFSPRPPVLAIYACVAWSGLCRTFLWTALSSYLQLVVPVQDYPRAAALNTTALHAATIAGPLVGGGIYGRFGAAAAYGCAAACFLAGWLLARRLRPLRPTVAAGASRLSDALSGLRFVFSEQVVWAAMTLDLFGVLFGGVDGVLPIFASLLGTGPAGLGLLKSSQAVGAVLCSLYLAHRQPFERVGRAFVACVAAFGLCMIAFAFSTSLWLSAAILFAAGVFDDVSMVIRSSIYQRKTPDELRGRVTAVNGIFIRSSNQLGVFESGAAAKLMGLVPSVIFGGCVTVASAAAAAWKAPELLELRSD